MYGIAGKLPAGRLSQKMSGKLGQMLNTFCRAVYFSEVKFMNVKLVPFTANDGKLFILIFNGPLNTEQ